MKCLHKILEYPNFSKDSLSSLWCKTIVLLRYSKINVIFTEDKKKIFRPKKSMCLERVSHMKFSIKSAYGGQPQVMYICMDGTIEDGLKCIIISSCGSKPWHAFELKVPLPRDAFGYLFVLISIFQNLFSRIFCSLLGIFLETFRQLQSNLTLRTVKIRT